MRVAKVAAIEVRRVFNPRSVTKASCALALLLFARAAVAQNPPGTASRTVAPQAPVTATEAPAAVLPDSEKPPAVPPKITYTDGLLRIDALDSTLADVLTKVAALTGVKIDVPASAGSERMPVVELGPGPARQILASLLSDSDFDYLIQASDADPEKIQSVLLMPREKKGGGTNGTEVAARPFRNPYVKGGAAEAPVAESPVPAQPENVAVEVSSLNPPPAAAQPDLSGQYPLLQPDSSNSAKPGALTPPPSLNPQSISQQLQQMYQQRVQMTQQDHYTGTQPVPPIPGAK